jgi:hypothetical protein
MSCLNAQETADTGLFFVRESLVVGAGAGVFLVNDVMLPSTFLVAGNECIVLDWRVDTCQSMMAIE